LHDRHRESEALDAISEAIRLDAFDPDYFALLAAIQLQARRWPAALEAAERGLRLDAEHVGCTNLRAIALVKLGRKAEAGTTIDSALARNPDNSLTHANQGWTYLEQGHPDKALEHFRESLRLNPDNEWARRGIVEALKARNIIYAFMLRYFLGMAKLKRRAQWGIVVGGYFGIRLLGQAGAANPSLKPWILPIEILYICFALMTWIADPLFNLVLRLNRFGRLALSREQTVASNWIGACLLPALGGLAMWFASGFQGIWLLGAFVFGFLLLPLAGALKCESGWPRLAMAAYTGVTAAVGIATLSLFYRADHLPHDEGARLGQTGGDLLNYFILAAVCSTWLVNVLLMYRRRR